VFYVISELLARLKHFDPGTLRLTRGFHLMLTIVCSVVLANLIAHVQPDVSVFKASVLIAASGAHCLLFTPIATRRLETVDILQLGAIVTLIFGVGGIVGSLSSDNAFEVLQIVWIAIIAFGFSLDGLGPFGARAGRIMSICWLFVIMSSQPQSPGLWLPVSALMGTGIALAVRIGLWRPSPQRTYARIEASFLGQAGDDLLACVNSLSEKSTPPLVTTRFIGLRKELRLCSDLLGGDRSVIGLSPETAAMMQLALEVVHDAMAQMTDTVRTKLGGSKAFHAATEDLVHRLVWQGGSTNAKPDLSWASPDDGVSRNDTFHVLRVAQAYKRLVALSQTRDPIVQQSGDQSGGSSAAWWQRLSWLLALQAGTSAAIAYLIGSFFELSHAYWITLTVIVILCSSLGTTAQKTFQRTAGTAAGVLIAMLLSPVLTKIPELRIGLILAVIPLTLVFIERSYTIAAGIISFIVVIGLQALEGVAVLELWSRIYDTFIGAAVGLGVAWLLFPRRTDTSLHDLSKKFLQSCAAYLEPSGKHVDRRGETYLELRQAAGKLMATVKAYRIERAPWSSLSGSANGLDVLMIVLVDYVVLYRQVRASVLAEAARSTKATEISNLTTQMDARVQLEFQAILDGTDAHKSPGLRETWMASLPDAAYDQPDLLADWVAMLYYARKIIRCLETLRGDDAWSEAFKELPS
jgi:fusaric acid resistance family protein